MSRNLRSLAVVALTLTVAAMAAVLVGGPASAEEPGSLTVEPATGTDVLAPKVHTSAGCPAGSDGYNAVLTGPGAFAAGFLITPPQDPGFSTTAGFDVQLGLSFADAATEVGTTIEAGDYTVTVNCIDMFSGEAKGTFAATVTFTTPTAYTSGPAVTPSVSTTPSASATPTDSVSPTPSESSSPTPDPTETADPPTSPPTTSPPSTPSAAGLPVTGPPTTGLLTVGLLFVTFGAAVVVAAGDGRRDPLARP